MLPTEQLRFEGDWSISSLFRTPQLCIGVAITPEASVSEWLKCRCQSSDCSASNARLERMMPIQRDPDASYQTFIHSCRS